MGSEMCIRDSCLQWKQAESPKPTDPSKEHFEFTLISYYCSSEKVCLHLFSWFCYNECQITLLFLQIYPSMIVYQITVTARGYYSQGGEMYQITLDLEQKLAMIEHFFS